MATSAVESPSGPNQASRLAMRIVCAIAVLLVGYQAIHFWLRDPLHYIIDHTEKSFGEFWPRRVGLWTHIAGGTLALFFGPFQFWTGLRRKNLAVHRLTGYLYITGILIGGGAAFYMAGYTQPPAFGIALYGLAGAWWITVGMAFLAIRRGRIDAHKEWMIRGYVVTLAFMTFRWLDASSLLRGLDPGSRATTIGWACWAVPLLLTEVVLQWRRTVGTVRR